MCIRDRSKSDYWQLDHEIKSKKLNDEKLDELMKPERWVDYQEIFGKKYNFEQAVGLQEALMLCDIEPDGRMPVSYTHLDVYKRQAQVLPVSKT